MGSPQTINEAILPDFDQILDECRKKLAAFESGDYEITPEVRSAYLAFNNRLNRFEKLELYRYSIMLARSRGGECWVPASTLRQCAIVVPYYRALMQYHHVFDQLVNQMSVDYPDKGQWCTALRDHTAPKEAIDRAHEVSRGYFKETYPNASSDAIDKAVAMFIRFITDYSWWLGQKQLTRNNDWYFSPLNDLLGRAMNSNEITTVIIENLASDSALRIAVQNMPHVREDAERGDEAPFTEEYKHTGDNIIVYGAPGVGKSYIIEHDMYPDAERTRVMFHPEYSYFDFVGTFRPSPVYLENGQTVIGEDLEAADVPGIPYIDYRYHAGPFTEMVIKATDNPSNSYCLIIEEINRANAASVFGDMFQLLDRGEDRGSDYDIRPQTEMAAWLRAKGHKALAESFRIPPNMSIVATMNSADLGVTFLDAAFKRRWNYRYIPIDLTANPALMETLVYNNAACTLAEVIGGINARLAGMNINEDRRVGPFFVGPTEMKQYGTDAALQKIIMYLWDDVFRDRRSEFFDTDLKTLGEVESRVAVADPFDIWSFIEAIRGQTASPAENLGEIEDEIEQE